jgi:hyperosmotically inducible protein
MNIAADARLRRRHLHLPVKAMQRRPLTDNIDSSDARTVSRKHILGLLDPMSRSCKYVCTLFATSLLVACAGCNQQSSSETVGQKLDRAIDKTKGAIDQAGPKLDERTSVARQRLDEKAHEAGAVIDDAAITAKIKAAILSEPGLKVLQINVETNKGVVTLTGTADSPRSSETAKVIAAAVAGVKSVDNRLVVRPSG